MFVKIMYWKVTKQPDQTCIYNECKNQIVYEAKSAELSAYPEDEIREPSIRLLLDVGDPERMEIFFPQESEDEVTEVYYMNDVGKTIERFVY